MAVNLSLSQQRARLSESAAGNNQQARLSGAGNCGKIEEAATPRGLPMAGQLIPPPELAPPPLPQAMSSEDRYLSWLDVLSSGERLLIAGMKHQAGPDGDWQQLYRQWYHQTEDDRLRHRIRRAGELKARSETDAS
jgi:hypothetical protein